MAANPDNKGYIASRLVDLLDVSQATDVIGSSDSQNNFHFINKLFADALSSATIVVDKDGNVRDNPAINIAYDNTGSGLNAVNAQEALDLMAGIVSGSVSVHTLDDTDELKALPGLTQDEQLNSLYGTSAPTHDDLIYVGYKDDTLVNGKSTVDNTAAGVWAYDAAQKTWKQIFSVLDSVDDRIEAFQQKITQLQKAVTARLVYMPTTDITSIDTNQLDIRGKRYQLSDTAPYEGIEVYLNGVLLVADSPTQQFDYQIDYATSTITFNDQAPAGSVVQVHILLPKERVVPPSVNIHRIQDLQIDPTTGQKTPNFAFDGTNTIFPLYSLRSQSQLTPDSAEQLAVFVNGRRLVPGYDNPQNPGQTIPANYEFTLQGNQIEFRTPPQPTDNIWAVYYEPGTGGGGAGSGMLQAADWTALQGMLATSSAGDAAVTLNDGRVYVHMVDPTATPSSWWEPVNKHLALVPDAQARLALREDKDIDHGALVVQGDSGWTYRYSDSSHVKSPPAVTLRYTDKNGNAPSVTNPVNPIWFVFTGLPAVKETTFINNSVLLDTNTGKTSRSEFRFTLQPGDGINEALAAIQAVLPPRGLGITGTDTVTDDLPPNLFVLDAFITAYSPPDPTAPITERNFEIFSDYITLPTWQDVRDLERQGHVREGMTICVLEKNSIFAFIHGAFREIFTENEQPNRLSHLVYDPELPAHERLDWHNARKSLVHVSTQTDLWDRNILPLSHMELGKLVFVEDEGLIYQLIADPHQGILAGDISDWQPLAAGVKYAGRAGGLPNPNQESLVDGQPYVIKMDNAGQDYYRLVTWDESIAARPNAQPTAITVTTAPGAANTDPFVIDFDDAGGTASVYERDVDFTIVTSQGDITGTVTVPPGSKASRFARELKDAIDADPLTASVLTVTKTAGTVTLTPIAGETIEAVSSVNVLAAQIPPARNGGWRFINTESWVKQTRAVVDQATDQKEGDLQSTIEKDHHELKVYDGSSDAWVELFSDDDINRRIASLSLFEGTTKEIGGTAVGAVELDQLPNLWTMGSQNDLSKVSHYWVYVGQPNYEVQSPDQEKQEVVAAGENWGDIKATPTPALPAPAGQKVRLDIQVLDQNGNPGGTVDVYKTWTLRVKIIRANPGPGEKPEEYHEVRVPINGRLGGLGASSVAHLVAGDWGKNSGGKMIGLTVGPWVAGQEYVEFTPDPGVSFDLMEQIDGGTPGIGEDLAGAVLNPGDWVQVANRGGDGQQGNPDPDLHYVTIGGNLLTKQRADGLYAIADWQDGAWEQGALVNYDGSIYRSKGAVTGDPAPDPKPVVINFDTDPATHQELTDLDGSALAALPMQGNDGDIQRATASGMIPGGGIFGGQNYNAGDVFVYTSDPAFNVPPTTTDEGYPVMFGWISLGPQPSPLPNPLPVSMTPSTTPWEKIELAAGVKVANTDADLPPTAPAGEVWIVLDSSLAGGGQALYGYDNGAQVWKELGGGGDPIDLTGGAIVYPRSIYHDGEAPADLTQTVQQPEIVGDTLWARNQAGYPLLVAVSKDGSTWSRFHPARFKYDLGSTIPGLSADHPMQLMIGMAGGRAKITHIANRSLQWQPVAEEGALGVIAKVKPLSQAVYKNSEVIDFDQAKLDVDLKAGRLYRAVAIVKIHTRTHAKGHFTFDIQNAPGSIASYYIDTPPQMDNKDVFYRAESMVFSVPSDETRTLMARIRNYTAFVFYYNWWSDGQMYVEDLGAA